MMVGLDCYEELGFAAPIRVMDEALALALAEKTLETRQTRPEANGALKSFAHLRFTWLYDIATSAEVLDHVEAVIGPDILIWGSGFFLKDPKDGAYISWHQDSTYWGLEPPTIVTAWIALTPSTPESGCLQVAPGTHKMEQLPHVDSEDESNLLSRGQEVAVDVSKLATADIVLRPGEMSLHHVMLVHGSEPNRATWPRLGYAIRYIPTSVKQSGGRTIATLARGVDRYGHFDLAGRPNGDLTPEAQKIAEEAEARLKPILMAEA